MSADEESTGHPKSSSSGSIHATESIPISENAINIQDKTSDYGACTPTSIKKQPPEAQLVDTPKTHIINSIKFIADNVSFVAGDDSFNDIVSYHESDVVSVQNVCININDGPQLSDHVEDDLAKVVLGFQGLGLETSNSETVNLMETPRTPSINNDEYKEKVENYSESVEVPKTVSISDTCSSNEGHLKADNVNEERRISPRLRPKTELFQSSTALPKRKPATSRQTRTSSSEKSGPSKTIPKSVTGPAVKVPDVKPQTKAQDGPIKHTDTAKPTSKRYVKQVVSCSRPKSGDKSKLAGLHKKMSTCSATTTPEVPANKTKAAPFSARKVKCDRDETDDVSTLFRELSIKTETATVDIQTESDHSDTNTVLTYDEDMTYHRNLFSKNHPERPERIIEAMKLLRETNLLRRVRTICGREVTRDEALTCHTAEYWEFLETLPTLSNRDLYRVGEQGDSIYVNNATFRAAKISVGSLLAVTDEVLSNRAVNGVAVIRPPGHHCKPERSMGFCFLGNVPIACHYAMNKYNLSRILILDWDVHHGNGTQEMFYEDKRVFYISIHRYDHGMFYPGGDQHGPSKIGAGEGEGFNLNVGWNETHMRDGDYLRAFYNLVLPLALEFQPELVYISAGFDSGLGDPLGNCDVTSEGYGMMTHHLMSISKGRVIVALEGGYNLRTVAHGMKACTSALVGDFPSPITAEDSIPSEGGVESIDEAGRHICKYWKTLQSYRIKYNESLLESVRAHSTPGRVLDSSYSDDIVEDSERLIMSEIEANCSNERKEPVRLDPEVFAVHPKLWCEHLEDHVHRAPLNLLAKPSCEFETCGDSSESWYCLTCYKAFCSRYVNEHMLLHGLESTHLLSLSMSDLSVWCYGCESYIHNELLLDAKNKGHVAKFGTPAVEIQLAPVQEES